MRIDLPAQKLRIQLHEQRSIEMSEADGEHGAAAALQTVKGNKDKSAKLNP